MRINHISVLAEYRKQREQTNPQTGAVSRILTFEDSDCNTFDVSVRDAVQFSICNAMEKAQVYKLELAFMSGVSRTSGNSYEMLTPAIPDFASLVS